ncbi:MAG: hypothetical protein JW749_01285 [Sedimentisphaerales bacterium]|nr:hypothetical protein [Sedimentisphaerales bacterium]
MAKINIDFSKFKAVLGALRPFAAMLWPLVIVLAAALVFTTAILMGKSFRQKVKRESIPLGNQVKTMMENPVPEARIVVERQYQDAYQQDASLIEKLAIQSTQRELISYDIFPQPKDTSALLFSDFSKKWRQKIEERIARINGKDCPGEEELNNLLQKSSNVTSARWNLMALSSEHERLTEEFFAARAKSASVYVNPAAIAGYAFWRDYAFQNVDKGVKDCWDWQIAYWIEEDVLATVGAMNAGSSSVFTSPVKRIMGIGFVAPDKLLPQTRGGFGAQAEADVIQERPKPVIVPQDQITESCTTRISNEDVNVVHFSVIVVLDTRAILPFMKELCSVKPHVWKGYNGDENERQFQHNQITILESTVRPVQADSSDHYKYRYGPDAVAEVRLICEYIFYKKGYQPVNPEMVVKEPKPDE